VELSTRNEQTFKFLLNLAKACFRLILLLSYYVIIYSQNDNYYRRKKGGMHMTGSKQLQWLLQEIEHWQENEMVDRETAERLKAYYREKGQISQGISTLSFALVLLGTSLVLLGIILILAKNWSALPRLARIFCSLLPLLTGTALGAFALVRDKDRRWREVSSLVMAAGVLTALAINGQIYHVISDPSHLFLFSALLSLPLIYIFSAEITSLFYLILISIYFGVAAANYSLSIGPFFLAGLVLLGLLKPWIIWQIRRGRLTSRNFWTLFAMAATGFVFITGLINYDVPVREIYTLYFFSLILLNALLFPGSETKTGTKDGAKSGILLPGLIKSPFAGRQIATLDLVGKLGLYFIIYILSFHGLWSNIADLSFRPLPTTILMIFSVSLIGPWLLLLKRDGRRDVLPLILPLIIVLLHHWANQPYIAVVATILFNLLFFIMGLSYLFQGIRANRLILANHGLLFIVLLVAARFLDIDFSFLVRGIVFILLGIGFLVTNLWLVRKKKEVHHG